MIKSQMQQPHDLFPMSISIHMCAVCIVCLLTEKESIVLLNVEITLSRAT
jgi:hypothetical protein